MFWFYSFYSFFINFCFLGFFFKFVFFKKRQVNKNLYYKTINFDENLCFFISVYALNNHIGWFKKPTTKLKAQVH